MIIFFIDEKHLQQVYHLNQAMMLLNCLHFLWYRENLHWSKKTLE